MNIVWTQFLRFNLWSFPPRSPAGLTNHWEATGCKDSAFTRGLIHRWVYSMKHCWEVIETFRSGVKTKAGSRWETTSFKDVPCAWLPFSPSLQLPLHLATVKSLLTTKARNNGASRRQIKASKTVSTNKSSFKWFPSECYHSKENPDRHSEADTERSCCFRVVRLPPWEL